MIHPLKPYKKTFGHSYVFGAFAVYELLNARPENALAVHIHSNFTDKKKLAELCAKKNIQVIFGDKVFDRVAQKESPLVFAVFSKYSMDLESLKPHICLINPMDMGNLGCILRSMAAFAFENLAIITPGADIFDPKTVRASMGAIFRISFRMFGSFDEYMGAFPGRTLFPFMTEGSQILDPLFRPREPYTLIFGNEAAGLPESFAALGQSLRIPQTGAVDSLNLSVAVSIGMYEFMTAIADVL